jgi:hypothetical protein
LSPNFSDLFTFQEHILDFPTEILELILKQTSNFFTISQTCTTFYDVSCNVKFLKLNLVIWWLNNDAIFHSIMSSNRRLKHFKIKAGRDNTDLLTELRVERLKQIIEKFGKNITEFEMIDIKFNPEEEESQKTVIIQMLKLMPNLETVDLPFIPGFASIGFIKCKLKLHKFKSLKSDESFDQLPPGVLEEVELFGDYKNHKGGLLFPNQHNIKKITTEMMFINRFEWKNLKLKSLDFGAIVSREHILNGQDQMETFKTSSLVTNQTSFETICKELKSLVELNIIRLQVDPRIFFELWKLQNIKVLKIDKIVGSVVGVNSFLSHLESTSLEKLQLCSDFLTEQTINQLAVNMPNLKELNLLELNTSINAVNSIIQNFPNLEILEFATRNFDTYKFQDGLSSSKLKSLSLQWYNNETRLEVPKLIKCCEKLEKLETSSQISKSSLIEILQAPNLKSVKLSDLDSCIVEVIDTKFLADIKEHCKKLDFFYCNSCCLANDFTPEMIKEEFKGIFDFITVHELDSFDQCTLEMNKSQIFN